MVFLRARYYDPQTGRFLQRDTVGGSSWDGRTLNRYTYAGGNPLRYVDPAGTDFQDSVDFLEGVYYGYVDSMSFGMTASTREAAGVRSADSDLYYLGRALGDTGATLSGVGAAVGSGGGELLATGATGGAALVAAPAAVAGVAYGLTEAGNASANAGRDLGTFFSRRQETSRTPDTCTPASPGASQAGSRHLPVADPARAVEINKTLDLIDSGGPFPHAEDGTMFKNLEGLLPSKAPGYYREYTVDTPGATTRGTRRIVQGAGGETYYTDDHYENFVQIDPKRY